MPGLSLTCMYFSCNMARKHKPSTLHDTQLKNLLSVLILKENLAMLYSVDRFNSVLYDRIFCILWVNFKNFCVILSLHNFYLL